MRQSAALTTRFLGALSQGLRAPTSMAEAPLVLVQARGNATKGGNGSAASKALLRKLADESKQEQDYKPDEIVAAGPPEGWTVDEKEGDCHVILSREAPGNQGETVEISVMASDDAIDTIALDEEEEGSEEGAEEDAIYEIPFTVNITKEGAGDGLVFDCVTDGDSFTIRKCVVESFEFPDMPGMENEEEAEADLEDLDEAMEPYRGPIFENLDPELQERFYDYLDERGVNEALVKYVHGLVFDKEQREYVRWLGRVRKFLEGK